MKSDLENRLYFHDLRLKLSGPEEVLVRFLSYVFYIVFTPAAVILLFSDVSFLRWLGVLFVLFLGDRVLRFGQGERSFPELLRSGRGNLNVASAFSPSARRAFSWAYRHARSRGRDFSLTLLSELAEHRDVVSMFHVLGVSREEFSRRAREVSRQEEWRRRRGELLAEAERLAVQAALLTIRARRAYIQPRALFAAVALSKSSKVQDVLHFSGISPADVEATALAGRSDREYARPRVLRRSRVTNRALASRPTPTLDRFSEDLVELAQAGNVEPLTGHEEEYERMLDSLSRPGKLNVMLVGEPGVGKTSLVYHLAWRMARDDVPPALFDKRVVALNVPHILSGGHPGEIANRLTRIADEITQAGNVIIFVPDLHELSGATDFLEQFEVILIQ